MRILHLSYDVPDEINKFKTLAIINLINCNKKYNKNICISLNRTTSIKSEKIHYSDEIISINNFGLPKGILFRYMLKRSKDMVNSLDIQFNNFDMIHAHKLTFEGPIAYDLYEKYKIPYIITLRHTDQVVLKYRKDLMYYYKKILTNASKIIIISPWMTNVFSNLLGQNFYNKISSKIINIPNIMKVDTRINKIKNNGRYLSVFHLKNEEIKRKNIFKVLDSIQELKKKGINIDLDIIGGGPAKEILEKEILEKDLNKNVKFIGVVDNSKILEVMSEYKAFILCSYPETFGMVYIEALCAGIPIIYVKDTGVDGFFNNNIGVSVNHKSIKSINNGFKEMELNSTIYKNNVVELQKSNLLDKLFDKESIEKKYQNILLDINKS